MSQGSNSNTGWLKWLIGIIISLLAAGSGIVALLNYFNPRPLPATLQSQPTSIQVVCHIAGQVLNTDNNNKPLPNIEVRYLRRNTTGETQDQQYVRSRLATTNTQGNFDADCSTVEAVRCPF